MTDKCIITMNDILLELEQNKVSLTLEGEDLLINFDGDELNPDILKKLKEHKSDLVSYLKKYTQEDIYQEIPKLPIKEEYKTSSSQYRIWVLGQSENISKAYHVPNSVRINTHLNIDAFEKAINATIQRHESLRTIFRFDAEKNQVFQKIIPVNDFDFTLQKVDCSDKKEALDYVEKHIAEDNSIAFSFEKGPLFRMCLFSIEKDSFIFYYNMHHIISDTWSLEILTRDLMEYYQSFVKNEVPNLPVLEIQYKDFADWSNGQEHNLTFQKDKEFWKTLFKEENSRLDFPTNKIRPKIKDYDGTCLQTYINPELTRNLTYFCAQRDMSLFMGLLGIWNILFYKYTGVEDLTIGTIVTGRDHLDLRDQIGCFINTLALRNKIYPDKSCNEFMTSVGESTLKAFEHQMFPFNILIDEVEHAKDASRGALFDVLIQLQNSIENKKDISSNIDFEAIKNFGSKSATSDIVIDFFEEGDSLNMTVAFNDGIYEEGMVIDLIKHFKQLIYEILQNPEQKIGELSFLSKEEIQQIFDFNSEGFLGPEYSTILDVFDRRVKENPDRIAIKTSKLVMSYSELDGASDVLASYLQNKYKVQQEDLIGMHLNRNEDQIISILGVLKSGAAYVPIDSGYPQERIDYILEETKCKLVINESEFVLSKQHTEVFEKVRIDPSSLAYTIYTSGSTGMPKGVMIEHKTLLDHILTKSNYFEVKEQEGFVLFSSISFDASIEQILLPLLNGGFVFIPTKEEILDIDNLHQIINDYSINHFHAIPSFLSKIEPIPSTTIKRIVSGGDVFNPLIAQKWLKHAKVYNQYGPTEITIGATAHLIQNDETRYPIGKPLMNNKCYILGPNKEIQPIGVVGEIYIGGNGVSRGYFCQDKLTAKKFVPNPFDEGEVMYATGDIGRWLPDGTIQFDGRVDDQVKINGYRIELQEIQSQLETKKSIQKAIIVVRNNQNDTEIVAFFSSEKKEELTEIRKFLGQKLPDYMIPRRFVQLDTFPLNTNGKVDFNKLSEKEGEELIAEVKFLEPKTEKEKILSTIWIKVLRHEKISRKDNFYYLGGDSIKLIQVIAKLRQEGWNIRVEHIIQFPVLEECALYLTRDVRTIDQKPVVGKVGLTPIQQAFFFNSLIVNKDHYNQSVILKSKQKIDTTVLQESINDITVHHDVLRMIFPENDVDRVGHSIASADYNCKIKFVDLSNVVDTTKEIEKYGADAQSSFNITEEPLLKIIHFRLANEDAIAIIIHHLIIDGVSWRILLEDFANIYKNKRENQEYKLPQKTDSYQSWTLMLKKYAKSENLQLEKKYWENICHKFSSSIFSERFKNNQKSPLDKSNSFSLSVSQTKSLLTKANQVYQTEINDTLLTSLGYAIKESFGINDTIIKMEGHGRENVIDNVDISRTIGWFTSVFPFLLQVSNSKSPVENLKLIKENIRGIPNKGIGYGVLRYLNHTPSLDIEPGVEFNYLGDFGSNVEGDNSDTVFEYGSEYIGDDSDPSNGKSIALSILGMVVRDQLEIKINYASNCFDSKEMETLTRSYKECLISLISELESLNEKQSQLIIGRNWDIGDEVPISYTQKYILNSRHTQVEIGPILIPNYTTLENFEIEFREFIKKHKVLTIEYLKKGDDIYQKIVDAETVKLRSEQIEINSDNEFNIQEKLEKKIIKPFDIFSGELVRLFVLTDNQNNQNYAYICVYHALIDAFTGNILKKDIELFFKGEMKDLDYVTNFDFSIWQQRYVLTREAHKQRQLILDNLKQANLRKIREIKTGAVECLIQKYTLEGSDLELIKRFSANLGLSLSSLFMGVHQEWLQNFYGDKVIQLVISDGREQKIDTFEQKVMLGITNNYMPIVTSHDPQRTMAQNLIKGYENYLENRFMQEIPFEWIREGFIKQEGVNIVEYVGGTFNFQSKYYNLEDKDSKDEVIPEKNSNDFTRGLDFTIQIYGNAIDINLSCYLESFNEKFDLKELINNLMNRLKKIE